ncbi:hypothetical protein AX17_005911 [Amanita inopinata Kibby_2008]|nr:hypothetical protein AX17_005911 [Amanita inopinata Kibby_2008]
MAPPPPILGINFGNTYASLAVFTKQGVPECIANQDGERQIACAIAFHGEEMYIGNQARPHLVKNSKNVIQGFRNLLGLSYDQLSSLPSGSLPTQNLVPHPDDATLPAYKVEVLQPAPAPLSSQSTTRSSSPPSNSVSASAPVSRGATPSHSITATPRSEPIPVTRYITPQEATTLFLTYLFQSAQEFLGTSPTAAVITVPSTFSSSQRSILLQAAKDASLPVLQLLDEAGAASLTTQSLGWFDSSSTPPLSPDRTQLLIDIGHSSTTVTLLCLRQGLTHSLAQSTHTFGGHTLDALLLKHFATEFKKKTKMDLNIDPQGPDARSVQKLLLALEHTKRTISASPSAASLSVESLKDGLDFTTTINRLRFDMLARPFYARLSAAVHDLLSSTQPHPTDSTTVDEIVYVGGTACLPGLDEHLLVSCGFGEEIESPFGRGVVVGGGVGDPTTVLARGCAVQAEMLWELVEREGGSEEGKQLLKVFAELESKGEEEDRRKMEEVSVAGKTIGVVFPRGEREGEGENGDAVGKVTVDALTKSVGGVYVPLVLKETPLPARRVLDLALTLPPVVGEGEVQGEEERKVVMEVWEVSESVKVEKRKGGREVDADSEDDETVKGHDEQESDHNDEEEEEEEEEEIKHFVVEKDVLLGILEFPVQLPAKKGGRAKKGDEVKEGGEVRVTVRAVRGADGSLVVEAAQTGRESAVAKVVLQV